MSFTEAEAPPPEEARSRLQQKAAELALLALAMSQDGSFDDHDAKVAARTARTVARLSVYAAIAAALRTPAARGKVNQMLTGRNAPARDEVNQWVEQATDRLVGEMGKLSVNAAQRMPPGSDQEHRQWAQSVGETLSTRLTSEAALRLAKPLSDQLGEKLHKVWMTRGDNRVRSLHQDLHGKTAELDKPFWRELGTPRELKFPGDPAAPLEQTINCRCFLWLVPAAKASKAEEVLHIPKPDFGLAASAMALDVGLRQDFEVAYGWAPEGA